MGLPQCQNASGGFRIAPSGTGAPATLSFFSLFPSTSIASGTSVLSLDAQTADGWQVSLVSGDLPSPDAFRDGGLLSGLVPGDRIRVTGQLFCQPFSGCKSYLVVRNAKDGVLLTADFAADATFLDSFAEALEIGLTLEPVCAFAPPPRCYTDEVETWHRLLVQGDDDVRVSRGSQAAVTIGGHAYTVWLGDAATVTGSMPVPATSGCIDGGSFWSTGAVSLTIARP